MITQDQCNHTPENQNKCVCYKFQQW